MSSYWAGYSGTGLVLDSSELEDMLETYRDKNPAEADIIDDMIDEGDFNEIKFIKGIHAGEEMPGLQDDKNHDYDGKTASLYELSDDNASGVTFWPFYRPNGTMNLNEKLADGTWNEADYSHPAWSDKNNTCYICFSEKDMNSPKAFEETPYATYDAFVQEFKDKWAAYLPEDFDWNAHLGYLSYACYA